MLNVYHGEFLLIPVPLEMSYGYCSHACAYCFSRRTRGCKSYGTKDQILKTLSNIYEGRRNDSAARLLLEGYPVCVSNQTDPFAQSNAKNSEFILSALRSRGVPVFIQTKGGLGAEAEASKMTPSVWYVSITTTDPLLSARLEPGAPLPEERLTLIKHLRQCGHDVIVGLNPLSPDWMGDGYKALLDRLSALGVWGVFLHSLHLKKSEYASVEESALLESQFRYATKRKTDPEIRDYFRKVAAYADEVGLHRYPPKLETGKTLIFDIFKKHYKKFFGTNQDFLNWVADNKTEGDVVDVEDYLRVVGDSLPDGLWDLDHNIQVVARNIGAVPKWMTYKTLLQLIWDNPKHAFCMARCPLFRAGDDKSLVVDRSRYVGVC